MRYNVKHTGECTEIKSGNTLFFFAWNLSGEKLPEGPEGDKSNRIGITYAG